LVNVPIKSWDETWSEYELADGTKLRVRPVVISIERTDAYTPDGDPIYAAKSQMILDAVVPAKLKRKVSK